MKQKQAAAIYDFASVLLTSIIAVAVIFTFFFKISTVNGDSMRNTLHNGDQLIITGYGYGHGLGLSQWGAEAMAEKHGDGKDYYKEILAHYYQGTKVEKWYQ